MEPAPGLPFVREVVKVVEVDSTNDLARRLLGAGPLATPALIWADRQTRGRGQGSNAWWSDDGSLTATVILDPAEHGLRPARQPAVALTVAAAAIAAIARRHPSCPAGIRWPNDVEAGGRKLGGILTERVETPGGPRLIVGVGLNVRTRLDDAPAEVRRMAASLAEWPRSGEDSDPIGDLLADLLALLPDDLRALATADPALPGRWNRLDVLAGSTVRVAIGDGVIEGVAAGIDDGGGLRLVVDGRARVIHAGRILRESAD